MQQIPDLHSKFAVRPRHVSKYGRHPIWTAEKGEEKTKKKEEEETTAAKYNGLPYRAR